MANLTELLRETMILKNLSPEQAAPFIGCTGRQVRRWISGESNPGPVHRKAIEKGIKKINREIPGDTPDGLVSWRAVKISDQEKTLHKKLDVFFSELIAKAGPGGRSIVIKLADEHFPGFEEIVSLASKLKVKLPVI